TTLQDTLLDELVAQTHDGFPEDRHPGEAEGQPSPTIRARNTHAISIVVGINRYDSFDPRIMVRGNNQWDHATDRNADKADVFEIELVEEPFNGFDEQLGTIVGLGNVRKAVPWIVEGVDRERIRKEWYELFKYIELSSERMQQDEGWSSTDLDVADGIAADFGRLNGNFWSPIKRRGRSWALSQRLYSKREENDEDQRTDDEEQQRHPRTPLVLAYQFSRSCAIVIGHGRCSRSSFCASYCQLAEVEVMPYSPEHKKGTR